MKKSIYSIMALLLAAGTITGCSLQGYQAIATDAPALLKPIDIPVNTAEITYRDIAMSSYYEATVVPYVEEYAFPISGTVNAVYYRVGDTVAAGDLLAEINHDSIDKRIENLEAKISSETEYITLVNEKYRLTIESLKQDRSRLSQSDAGKIALINYDIAIYETKIKQNNENLTEKLEPLNLELEELKEAYSDYFITLQCPAKLYIHVIRVANCQAVIQQSP
ncbi:MAG: biotin/lipoyl-binding protein [Lachnospiraceae bacterium]|nr:biotin/lipoyl-binding protein [Lachnospiraceae bacterium]